MKKLLLLFFLMCSAGIWAQSKTTGVVNLLAGMTAQLELNNTTTTATLTFTGPSDRWFALQFGSFATGGGMQAGQDVVYYNGTTLVDAVHNGVGVMPSADAVNNWTVTSNTVSGGTRTIVATRPFIGSAQDYNFVYSDTSIDFAFSRGDSPSFALAYHGVNRGYALNKVFSCVAPAAPAASAQAFCSGATVANLSATGAAGATFSWYTGPAGGTALGTGVALVTGNYYVSQTVDACESTRTMVAVTITTVNPPTAEPQTVCGGATIANLNITGAAGATFTWYDAVSGGTILAIDTELETGNYFVSQTVGTCESARATVAVTVFTPEDPEVSDQELCEGATIADIMTEGNLSWYDDAIAVTPLPLTTVLATGDYYVSQTQGTCESDRTMVMVTINPVPDAPTGDDTQDFNEGETIASLEITTETGATITWYMNTGGDLEVVPTSTVLTDGAMYFATQTINNCESDFFAITANEALSTAMFGQNNFKAYPNPVDDVLSIASKENITSVKLYNLLGQEMLNAEPDRANVMLLVSKLESGTYIVKITLGNGESASLRIIKE